MTLLRQLLLVMFLVFVVLFTATMVVNVLNARKHVEEQLVSHSQDAATSLSLSIQHGSGFEITVIERMLAVVFDRGLYQRIEFESEELGGVVKELPVSETGAVAAADVPAWFLNLLELPAPTAVEDVSSGWSLIGKIHVQSSPEGAYRDLWRIAREQFRTFVVVLILASVLMGVILHYVLRPLRDVEAQAVAISEREFRTLSYLPRTRELRRVVTAMNRMVDKLKKMFSEQVELAERFRAQSLRDPVTGLGNRREFDNRLNAYLGSRQGTGRGCIFFLSIEEFGEYNDVHGHVAADLLLEQVGKTLVESLKDVPNAAISRNAGANFAVFLPNVDAEKASVQIEQCFEALSDLHAFREVMSHNVLHIGAAYNDSKRDVAELLSEADMALRTAQSHGSNNWVMYARTDETTQRDRPIHQASEWQEILNRVLDTRALIFHYQPVFSIPDKQVLHTEVLARIEVDGEIVSAGGFLPMAERFYLLPRFDRLIIELALEKIAEVGASAPKFCVNISPHSLESDEFVDWLMRHCGQHPQAVERLILEVPEFSVQNRSDQVRRLVAEACRLGAEVSIDHFGVGATTFSYLQSLPVNSVKVDNSFIRDIHSNQDNQFFVKSMCQIAHGQEIAVYAEGVENDAEWAALQDLKLDGAMGFGLQRPGPDL